MKQNGQVSPKQNRTFSCGVSRFFLGTLLLSNNTTKKFNHRPHEMTKLCHIGKWSIKTLNATNYNNVNLWSPMQTRIDWCRVFWSAAASSVIPWSLLTDESIFTTSRPWIAAFYSLYARSCPRGLTSNSHKQRHENHNFRIFRSLDVKTISRCCRKIEKVQWTCRTYMNQSIIIGSKNLHPKNLRIKVWPS
jgi:hypothetical protein